MAEIVTVEQARAAWEACKRHIAQLEAKVTALTTPPDFGVEHKLLTDWINSLPEPFRSFVTALETNADPSGTIRDAVCQRENAMALAKRVRELEAQLLTRDARIAEACVILSTPGTWSDFAARARKVLTDG